MAWATNDVFIQMWVGTEDSCAAHSRDVCRRAALKLRHDMQLSNWQLNPSHAPGDLCLGQGRARAHGLCQACIAPAPAKKACTEGRTKVRLASQRCADQDP
ncbi:MAG: hypothetical protein IPG16_04625 [Comamonadaceae bacterium]|nr:hypothetical protein [Comamonadaceae bacterium]